MGTTSSQLASQTATEDVPLTSQPRTQIPAMDGTQEDQLPMPGTRKRVASNAGVERENTIKKARRAKRKSVPQHIRGFAIQPSQTIRETQQDTLADAEAETARCRELDGINAVPSSREEVPVVQSTDLVGNGTKKADKARRKRKLPWAPDTAETASADALLEHGPLEEVNGNIVHTINPDAARQKKRKHNSELVKLQKDAEDFAPEIESTPLPKLASTPRERAKQSEPVAMTGEDDIGQGQAAPKSKRQKRTKSAANAPSPQVFGEAANFVVSPGEPQRATQAQAKAPTPRTYPLQETQPDEEPKLPNGEGARGNDAAGEESLTARDSSAQPLPAGHIPTPPESPGAVEHGERRNNERGEGEVDRDVDAKLPELGGGSRVVSKPDAKRTKHKDAKTRKKLTSEEAESGAPIEKGARSDSGSEEKATRKQPKLTARQRASRTHLSHDGPPAEGFQSTVSEVDDVDYDDNKTSKKKQHSIGKKVPVAEPGQIQGMWSKDEKALADEVFHGVLRDHDIADWALKANIIDWAHPTPALMQFKNELRDAFPQRPVRSITRFCQRRYNSYDRGKWSVEEDQHLREAYALMPDQWTGISDFVGRFWEDCRVRWRDVLSRSEAVTTGPWSSEEETRLAIAVQECCDIVLKEAYDDDVRDSSEKAEALISWKGVAEKMGHTRTAKRCREKWRVIKGRDSAAETAPTTARSAQSERPSKRLRAIENDYQRCQAGDIYDMLIEICAAVPDLSTKFDLESTFWSVVAVRNPESTSKSALKRRAFWAALEEYPCKAVWEAETMAAKAHAVKERMERLERKGKIEFGRQYGALSAAVKAKKRELEESKAKTGYDEDATGLKKEKAATQKDWKGKKSSKPKVQASGDEAKATKKVAAFPKKPSEKPAQRTASHDPSSKRKFLSETLVVESDDEQDGVEVAHALDESQASGEGDAIAGDRQPTEDRSLGSASPGLSPSTFVDLCTGGKRDRHAGKEDKGENKNGVKKRKGMKA